MVCAGGHVADVMRAISEVAYAEESTPPAVASFWEDERSIHAQYLSTTTSDGRRMNPMDWFDSVLSKDGAGKLYVLANTAVDRMLFTACDAGVKLCGLVVGEDGRDNGGCSNDRCFQTAVLELKDCGHMSEVLLCAGAIQTPRILLASAGQQSPTAVRKNGRINIFGSIQNAYLQSTEGHLAGHERLFVHTSVGGAVSAGLLQACCVEQAGEDVDVVGSPLPPTVDLSAVGSHTQDHVLLPIFYINVSNMLSICVNMMIWVYNFMIYAESLQAGYRNLSSE